LIGERWDFANELDSLLGDIGANISDPVIGMQLVATFLETDSRVFERCDNSSGQVGGMLASRFCSAC
jgi:hypothetical protein